MAFRLSNSAAATRHATATVDNPTGPSTFADRLSSTPGETHEVVSRHDDSTRFNQQVQYDTVTYRAVVGSNSTQHRWKRPLTCPVRHNDVTDDNLSDQMYLRDYTSFETVYLSLRQSGEGRYDNGAALINRTAFPWNRFRAFTGDFSGDHKVDLLAIRSEQAGRVTMHRVVSTGERGYSSFAPIAQVWDSGVNGWWLDRMQPVVGDFNDDGHEDLGVFYRYDGARTALWLFDGTTNGISTPRMVWDSGAGNWDAANTVPYAGDFNGDGKTDIGAMYKYSETSTGAWSWLSNGTAFAAPLRAWQHNSWSLSKSKVITGDFNGDGRGDVATLYSYANWEWKLWTMTGREDGTFNPAAVWYTHPQNWADPARITLTAGDYNGDGRADVGYMHRYPTEVGLWKSLSSGATFASPSVAARNPVGNDATALLP